MSVEYVPKVGSYFLFSPKFSDVFLTFQKKDIVRVLIEESLVPIIYQNRESGKCHVILQTKNFDKCESITDKKCF